MHTKSLSEFVDLDRRAVQVSVAIARQVTAGSLDAQTPCAGWTVADLLRHMSAQHRGFAAAANGTGGEPGVWDERVSADPVEEYLEASQLVIDAFSDPRLGEREMELPELTVGAAFPPAIAVSFHFIDYVAHGWDLARAIGVPLKPAADVVEIAAQVAAVVPTGEAREVDGAAFAPVVGIPAGGRAFDRVLAQLGRDPDWAPTVPIRANITKPTRTA